jgi:hypothetical protein
LDFVHRLYFNKITTFQKLDLLPSSGKKGAGYKPRPGLRLTQPWGPIARVSIEGIYGSVGEEIK